MGLPIKAALANRLYNSCKGQFPLDVFALLDISTLIELQDCSCKGLFPLDVFALLDTSTLIELQDCKSSLSVFSHMHVTL